MSTEFEFFEGTATVQANSPQVTIRKSGQLVLTEAAVEMLGDGVEAVQIGYNAKTQTIGLRPASEDARGVLKLRRQPNGRSRLIDGKRFFAHHSLALEKARGLAVEDFGNGVVGFRLAEQEAGEPEAVTSAPASSRRRKAS